MNGFLASVFIVVSLPVGAATMRPMPPLPEGVTGEYSIAGRETTLIVARRATMGALRSFDGGLTWSSFTVSGADAGRIKGSPTDARTLYATANGHFHRTRDGGDTWTRLTLGEYSEFEVGASPELLVATRPGPSVWDGSVSGPSPGIRVSTDGGSTWRDRDYPKPFFAARVTLSPADAGIIFVLNQADVWRSDDQGITWRVITPAQESEPSRFFNDITLDRHDPDIAYVVANSGNAWATRDGGGTWTAVPTRRGPQRFARFLADPLAAGRAFVFTDEGVSETRDGGESWVWIHGLFSGVPVSIDGSTRIVGTYTSRPWQLEVGAGAIALGSDLWWTPSAPGTGLTITQHASNRPFVVWYAYDASGNQVWRVIPGGTWNDRTFSGEMYETTGPAYFGQAFDSSRVTAHSVGTATLRFTDHANATFSWRLGAASGEQEITRQVFAPPAPVGMESFADLWWNEAEPGWGIAINHQSDRIFATWYVYGDDGKPLWVTMPDAKVMPRLLGPFVRSAATGDIYITRGPPSTGPFDPSAVVVTKVGTADVVFNATDRATLTYTAFGRTETRAITRQPF